MDWVFRFLGGWLVGLLVAWLIISALQAVVLNQPFVDCVRSLRLSTCELR
jgi:hypothetical protein